MNFRIYMNHINKSIDTLINELQRKKLYRNSGHFNKYSGYISFTKHECGINYYIEEDYIEIISGSYRARFINGIFIHACDTGEFKEFRELNMIRDFDFIDVFKVFINDYFKCIGIDFDNN